MEKLSKIACYFRWNRGGERDAQHLRTEPPPQQQQTCSSSRREESSSPGESPSCCLERRLDASMRFFSILESILLWENSVNSISVVIVFNILFWGIVVLEVRGFAAASSAALVVVLCYSTLEAQVQRDNRKPDPTITPRKVEQFDKIVNKAKSTLESLKLLRKNQPGVFCTGVCALSIGLWLIGGTINGVLLAYVICMSILVGPALMLQVPCCKVFSTKDLCNEYTVEWESEMEEFLPAVTEDSLEVLQRAGDSGEHSPTSQSVLSENQIDPFNEDELVGLKMPSHEDGSTDGLDVSELELSPGETEVDAIKIQSEHFEPGSSSEDDGDLEPMSRKLPSPSDESDSDFEIIDSHEIDNLEDV